MTSLERPELMRWHAAIGAQYLAAANKALIYLKAIYNKAVEWGLYTGPNPCLYIKKFPASDRSRFVQPGEEMRRLQASLAKEVPAVQTFFLLLLLTGARRSEVNTMKWQDLNLETGLWTKAKTKTRRPQSVTVPQLALTRLRAMPRVGEYVFVTRTGKPWAVNRVEWTWSRIRARAGLDDVTIHDLRRTCASWLAIHGANLSVIQQVLNHSSLQHTAIYARLNLTPVAAALEANAQRMCADPHLQPSSGGSS
jgi:integrase